MINIVDGKPYLDQVKELITEYTDWLGRDLSFQDLDKELADIAEKYTASNGEVLVAVDDSHTVLGMVAYYQHSDTRCEMKRLYVRPEGRGHALGDRLIESIMEHAKQSGYTEMVLDTIEPLKAAIYLYKKHGFTECEPYYYNPMDDVIYMRKALV
ncbi:GNAT family N-acetyltransferase [Veillonella sp. AS16]|uniref:GNAT family N-acetyltransferase n=1 Tax=Veillonella sp. AS16 TaxID=936589 RepID=UPI0003E26908|nr:GNAT family N-acetyltransferase [Veillonella sp. AS16]ETS92808.1 FR47-like protein [Veillonella sp. AS16]